VAAGAARRLAGLLALGAAALSLGGCELLLGAAAIAGVTAPGDGGGVSAPFESFGPEGPGEPSPLATYTEGRATIELSDGSTIVLDRISPGPHLFSEFGSNVRWSNADGWYLSVSGAGAIDAVFGAAYLQVDRVAGGVHWTSDGPSRCRVAIQTAKPSGLSGTATCSGLHWVDALGGSFGGLSSPVPGEPPFDAQITFEAAP